MENHSRVTGWQELFFLYNPLNFRRLSQSLLLRYTAEIYRLPFSKVNCVRVYRKLITRSTNAKGLSHIFCLLEVGKNGFILGLFWVW